MIVPVLSQPDDGLPVDVGDMFDFPEDLVPAIIVNSCLDA